MWAYAAHIRRHPDWMCATPATVLQGEGSAVGARGRERLVLGPLKLDIEFEVAEAEPGRRLVWRALAGDPRFRSYEVALDLQVLGERASHATYRGAVELRGLWRLLTPLFLLEGPSGIRRELQRLKERVESPPS
jgi:hypothetical protein